MYESHLYIIENHTNMHVGSGDANFDLIDKQIQRDAVTGYPVIHSSSLKGALKEYCEFRHEASEAERFISHVFGDAENAGKMRFLDAHLLGVPMRSDTAPYFVCTSPTALRQYLDTAELFHIDIADKEKLCKFAAYDGQNALSKNGGVTIETLRTEAGDDFDFPALEQLVGGPAALIPDAAFELLLKDLPVIARNQLENGESKNLWYEEVLPRKSRLFTVISEPTYLHRNDTKLANHFERLHTYLTDGKTIQLGANASVGYGVCTFEEVQRA